MRVEEYDHAGRVVREYDAADNFVSYEYDMAGQMIKTADKAANASSNPYYTTYEYDGLGNVICETVPQDENQSKVTKYKYDANGRVLEERVFLGTETVMENGVEVEREQYRVTEYGYNPRGNMTVMRQDGISTYYAYDELGRVKRMSGTGEKEADYTYDRFGNCLTVTSYGQTEHYEYDINSVLTKYTDKAGVQHTYTNDGLGRVVKTETANETPRVVAYTLSGQIGEISEAVSNYIIRFYDDRGMMIRETEPQVEKEYVYDIGGNRREFTLKNLMTNSQTKYFYNYNDLGQLSAVHDAQTLADSVTYTYDANGRVIGESKGSVNTTYRYFRDGSVWTMSALAKAGDGAVHRSYTYYPDGNVKTKRTAEDRIVTYTYDGRNQLASETDGASTTTYAYDADGNRVSKTTVENGVTSVVQYGYNSRGLLESESADGVVTSYAYDENGNLISKSRNGQTDAFVFDGYGQLKSATVGGITASYAYRPDGLRLSKTVGGVTTRHVYDGDQVTQDLDENCALKARYARGLNLIDITTADGTRKDYIQIELTIMVWKPLLPA